MSISSGSAANRQPPIASSGATPRWSEILTSTSGKWSVMNRLASARKTGPACSGTRAAASDSVVERSPTMLPRASRISNARSTSASVGSSKVPTCTEFNGAWLGALTVRAGFFDARQASQIATPKIGRTRTARKAGGKLTASSAGRSTGTGIGYMSPHHRRKRVARGCANEKPPPSRGRL